MSVHYVYRLFADDGSCLYVGATNNVQTRVAHHRRRTWGAQIATIEVTEHPDRESAEFAESDEIRRRQPTHNVRGLCRSGLRPGALQDVIYGFIVDNGPIGQIETQRLLNATGYTGHTDSAVSSTLKRLLDGGFLTVAGTRPASRGRYKTARLYAATTAQQGFYAMWFGDWRVAA